MNTEIRYYISGKKTWNDVTDAVISKKTPVKGQIINVGKIRMTVKDVTDGVLHGRTITKVLLEDTHEPYTHTDQILESIIDKGDDITILEICNPIVETKVKTPGGYNAFAGISSFSDTIGSVSIGAGPGSITGLGSMIKNSLGGIGNGYSVSVADFGEVVSVTVTYSNTRSGASASQTFAVIYRGPNTKYAYTAYSTAARYRHCNSYQDAANFIRGRASALAGRAGQI